MIEDLTTVMGRALEHTRAGDPMAASRVLQEALTGHTLRKRTQAATGTAGDGASPKTRAFAQAGAGFASATAKARPSAFRRPVSPPVPDGATYTRHRFESAFGARDYCLFTPSRREEPLQGVVLMLHGCTQNADDFAAGTAMNLHAERCNMVVAYPDQTRQHNQMGCWNWFRAEDQGRRKGETALLAQLASHVATDVGLAHGRVFAAGLSAGGAMCANLAAAYPDVFSAIGVHSGLAPGVARDLQGAYAAMRGQGVAPTGSLSRPIRAIVFHGTADTTVAPSNADAVIAACLGNEPVVEIRDTSAEGADVTLFRSTNGHSLAERWMLPQGRHAWSGGSPEGSHTDPNGPDASAEMMRFFLTSTMA